MALGTVMTIVACGAPVEIPNDSVRYSSPACTGGLLTYTKKVYVLNQEAATNMEYVLKPWNTLESGQVFSTILIATMTLYLSVKAIGILLKFIVKHV